MFRKGNRSILIIAVVAILVFILTTTFLAEARGTSQVLVASRTLAVGTRLNKNLVEVREIPKAAIMPDALTQVEDVENQVITVARTPGDQITKSMVGDKALSGIAATLAPTERAVAVRVDKATGLSGILQVGDRVTVVGILDPQEINLTGLSTGSGSNKEPAGPVAMVTLSGLRVLLVPQGFRYQEMAPEEEGGSGLSMAPVRTTSQDQNASVILLAVPTTPQTLGNVQVNPVELLALLNAKGKVHLALDPAANPAPSASLGVRIMDVYNTMAIAKPTVLPSPSPTITTTRPTPPPSPSPTGGGAGGGATVTPTVVR